MISALSRTFRGGDLQRAEGPARRRPPSEEDTVALRRASATLLLSPVRDPPSRTTGGRGADATVSLLRPGERPGTVRGPERGGSFIFSGPAFWPAELQPQCVPTLST